MSYLIASENSFHEWKDDLGRKVFGRKRVVCLVCGKELSTLAVHLKSTHDMTAKEYREKFDVPSDQPLTSKAFTAKRRRIAIEKGLDKNLLRGKKKV